MAAGTDHQDHHHGPVHLDEADWRALADQAEREGELLLDFVTDTAAWVQGLRGPRAAPVRRVIDIGSGPGVGSCELAVRFPEAQVVAVDSSPAMLERVARRSTAHGLDARIATHLAELPGGLDGIEPADLIWASMSLHHVGDEVAALRVLRDHLGPDGLLAIAESEVPMGVLPDDLDMAGPGFVDRIDRAGADWFASMREGLTDSVPSGDLPTMLASAGLEVVGSRLARKRLDPPLPAEGRALVREHLRRLREHLAERLDRDDLRTLDVLLDAGDPRGVEHRHDLFVAASRQITVARAVGAR